MEEQNIVTISRIAAEAAAAIVIKSNSETATALATTNAAVEYIKEAIDKIERKIDNKYVTKDEFAPVRMVVYGLVGLILVTVVGAVIAAVVVTKSGA